MTQPVDALEPEGGPAGTPASSSVHQHETTQLTNWVQELADEGHVSKAASQSSEEQINDPEKLTPYQKFRHSGWQRLRSRIRDSLIRSSAPTTRVKRFDRCGKNCALYKSTSLEILSIRGSFCKNKACIPCMTARAMLVQSNVTRFIKEKTVRFLTCTLKQNGKESVKQMLDRLRKSLTLLYRRDEWKLHVKGWVTFIEIKRGARFGGWHVHAHMLTEGSFWQQNELSREWHACTGDSMIVDIRAVHDARGGAYYAAKYATKGCNLNDLDQDADLDQVIAQTLHRRLISVHGTWKGKLDLYATPEDPGDWEHLACMDSIVVMSANGDIACATLFEQLLRQHQPHPPPRAPPPPASG